MPTTKARKPKPAENPPAKAGEKSQNLWSQHGVEDVYFQREAQVNFWGVMGGLQAAALLTQLTPLWAQMQAGRWQLGLYFVSSILIIVLGWALLSWGAIVLKEQITILNTFLIFFGNFALAVQCLLITQPAGWLAATALAALSQWVQQNYFRKVGAWDAFSDETVKRLIINNRVYLLWPILCVAGALHLFLAPSAIAETAWGVLVLVVVVEALFRQHRGMERERNELGIP